MGTTNYVDTFIAVAEDCPATAGTVPPAGTRPTVARLTWEVLTAAPPYTLTSDDVLFAVHAARHGIADGDRTAAREAFFSRSQACLRASPLTKTYGWGIHFDDQGRAALYGVDTEPYQAFSQPGATTADGRPIEQKRAMRSKRR